MRASDLAVLLGARILRGDRVVDVTGVRQDSRRVEPGDLFASRPGLHARDGAFIADALSHGAVALLVAPGTPLPAQLPAHIAVIEVGEPALAIGQAASNVYGEPTRALRTVGITGTNGKTTSSSIVCSALGHLGHRAGLVGTLGHRFEDWSEPGTHTTPEADDLMRLAAEMRRRGATHLVMEVSSHALSLARVEAVQFAVAAFTNLTQDHLDFHRTMDDYGAAKARLFTDLAPGASVINVDDAFGRHLATVAKGRVLRVSTAAAAGADVRAIDPHIDARGVRSRFRTPHGEVTIDSTLLGAHNLANLGLGLGILLALDEDPARAAEALSNARAVPGRLERCDTAGDDITVLVDYAHTPDALDRVLHAMRDIAPARIVCVFGCGGDRDPTKRAPMGRIVAEQADVAIVTNDNPRTEDPAHIIQQILAGMTAPRGSTLVESDRARAIALSIETATAGDIVLIAGKGHEDYQIVGTTRSPFSDVEHARAALSARRGRKSGHG